MSKEVRRLVRLTIASLVFACASSAVLCAEPAARLDGRQAKNEAWLSEANKLVIDRLANSIFSCPEKIWPGWQTKGLRILIVDIPQKNAILLSAAEPSSSESQTPFSVAPVSYDSLSPHLKKTGLGYAYISWPLIGRILAVHHSVSNESGIGQVVELVLHEAFHLTGQSRFGFSALTFTRGPHFPDNADLRYLRRRIIDGLRKTAQGDNRIGEIAFWVNQVRDKYGAGLNRLATLDAAEGSAEYVRFVGSSITTLGCEAAENVILSKALERLDSKWRDFSAQSVKSFPESESYVIGAYSGLLLRKSGRTGWERATENGQSMLDQLVMNVGPESRPEDPELQVQVNREVTARNEFMKSRLDALRTSLQSPERIAVSIPRARLGVLYPQYGYVTYEGESGKEILVALGARVPTTFSLDFGTIELREQIVQIVSQTPCGAYRQAVFSVSKDAISEPVDGNVRIATAGIVAELLGVSKRAHEGLQWLCAPRESIQTPRSKTRSD